MDTSNGDRPCYFAFFSAPQVFFYLLIADFVEHSICILNPFFFVFVSFSTSFLSFSTFHLTPFDMFCVTEMRVLCAERTKSTSTVFLWRQGCVSYPPASSHSSTHSDYRSAGRHPEPPQRDSGVAEQHPHCPGQDIVQACGCSWAGWQHPGGKPARGFPFVDYLGTTAEV